MKLVYIALYLRSPHCDQRSIGLRNCTIRHRYQPTSYSLGNRASIFLMSFHLAKRRNPLEIDVHCCKFEVTRGHFDLEIEPLDIVTNLKATILAIEA